MKQPLICPSCGEGLLYQRGQKNVVCANGHVYDEAKEGYLNLLLSHLKNSKQPGDTKEMLQARRRYLEAGFYHPIAERVSRLIASCSFHNSQLNLVDIGCGEGYYLKVIAQALNQLDSEWSMTYWGIDISKDAIKMAAKSEKNIKWLVGNNFKLPFADTSVDVLVSVFSPIKASECARILVPNGYLIQVYPFEEHLTEIKDIVYDAQKINKDYEKYLNAPEGFQFVHADKVAYKVKLDSSQVLDLLQMTPHYWKLKEEKRIAFVERIVKEITVSMGVVLYRRGE